MVDQTDLRGCLNDRQYRPLRSETLDRLKLKPHHALYHHSNRWIVVLLKRGHGGDYSTNTNMVKSLCELQGADKVAEAFLAQYIGGEVVAWETAKNVARKINGVSPREGDFGPYLWLSEYTFIPAGTSWSDEELPF